MSIRRATTPTTTAGRSGADIERSVELIDRYVADAHAATSLAVPPRSMPLTRRLSAAWIQARPRRAS